MINISIERDYREEKEQIIEGFSIVTLSANERVRVALGFFKKEERAQEILLDIFSKLAENKSSYKIPEK